MAAPIVAKSLSTLTDLANKPPSRKWEVKLDPLVLYIARVPGSKDVFLTPLKPRDRVVTAEDVESCLYYIHVSSVEDESVVSNTQSPLREHDGNRPPIPTIPRANHPSAHSSRTGTRHAHHPLPEIPRDTADNSLPYPLEDGPPSQGHHPLRERTHLPNQIPRKPAPSAVVRKPIAQSSPIYGSVLASPTQENLSQASCASLCPLSSEYEPDFTVIRRNPATGEQWNVGSVADPLVFEVTSEEPPARPSISSTSSTRSRKCGQPLYLSITNPGYAKFSSSDSVSSDSFLSSSRKQTQEPCFQRRMWLEGSHFDRKHAGHRSSLSVDQASLNQFLSPQSSQASFSSRRPSCDSEGLSLYTSEGHRRSHDDANGLSTDWTSGLKENHRLDEPRYPDERRLSLQSEKRSSTRGYTFISPWGDRCELAAGLSGNSLKCKVLPGTCGSSNSPTATHGPQPTQISELRFNLPLVGTLTTDSSSVAWRARDGKRKSRGSRFLARLHDRPQNGLADDPTTRTLRDSHGRDLDNESRLDLSLGQELAGGGFAGRQAKLGKLIIEGEGLLMMDLLVSANMALWFRAWDKKSRE